MGLALIALLLMPFSILFSAFVLTELWTWFVVPFGVMSIGLAHAAGISILIRFVTHQHNVAQESKGTEAIGAAIAAAIVLPLMAWGLGAVAHYFM